MPIRTDEQDASSDVVYYGGVNVALQQRSALFRYLPKWMDRILDSPRLLRRLGRLAGGVRPAEVGALTVSVLSAEDGALRKELTRLIEALSHINPDLVCLPNLMFTGIGRAIRKQLGVPVLCELAGEDYFLDALCPPHKEQAYELIRETAQEIDGFISPTKYYTSRAAKHFGLEESKIEQVCMGIQVDDIGEPAQLEEVPFTVGYLAAICPEKGLSQLASAFIMLAKKHHGYRLRIAGYMSSNHRSYWKEICNTLVRSGLAAHVDFVGEVNRREKLAFLQSLHVFSVPATHPEPKGFYILEALACGVPVVQPKHGAFPELVESTQGGFVYDDAGDPTALANAIHQLRGNRKLRCQLGRQGRAQVLEHFNDYRMAEAAWSVYERYAR